MVRGSRSALTGSIWISRWNAGSSDSITLANFGFMRFEIKVRIYAGFSCADTSLILIFIEDRLLKPGKLVESDVWILPGFKQKEVAMSQNEICKGPFC